MPDADVEHKTFRVTIRVGILSVFISAFLVLSIFVLTIISIRFYETSRILTSYVTDAISKTVVEQVNQRLTPAAGASDLAAQLIATNTLSRDSVPQLIEYTMQLLSSLPQTQMAYFGDAKGNFTISRKEPDGTISSEVINFRQKPAQRYKIFRDKDGKQIRQETNTKFDYDPRKRPWYIGAQQAKGQFWTEVYFFYTGNNTILGITSAAPVIVDDKVIGVFGVDVQLEEMSRLMGQLKVSQHGITFIADGQRRLIAFPNRAAGLLKLDELPVPAASAAYNEFNKTPRDSFVVSVADDKYFVNVLPVPGFANYDWHIYIAVPESDITAPIWKANLQTLMYCILILMVGLTLTSMIARRISKPIHDLAEDLERVKNFEIRDVAPIKTRVREVYIMSSAIAHMKQGLQTFEKYVPRTLVQKLITSGEAEKRGGRPAYVTLFFSDIDNFTALSEQIDDENVMTQMCDYFDVLTKIIRINEGTIDKYIGDALMCFWNAPVDDPDHVYHACKSAIDCQKALKVQNAKWFAEGKMPFPTRIGIHTGNVIVGNLGSDERMNYTAIGDNANIASRLEEINKVYGTDIIVSEESYKHVKDKFIFRSLDRVVVKGRKKSHYIYELLGELQDANAKQLIEFSSLYQNAFNLYCQREWSAAIQSFKLAQEKMPKDVACDLLIERCEQFAITPPPENWDGVWVYTKKSRQQEAR